jgi:hypothetical protein
LSWVTNIIVLKKRLASGGWQLAGLHVLAIKYFVLKVIILILRLAAGNWRLAKLHVQTGQYFVQIK